MDGPYAGAQFALTQIQDTMLVADEPLTPQHPPVRDDDVPVPMAVYELVTEFREPGGRHEATYTYRGHRYPRVSR